MAECAAAFPEPYLLTETENKINRRHAGIAEQARADFSSVSKSARTIGKNQCDGAASGEGDDAFTRRALMGSMTTHETQS